VAGTDGGLTYPVSSQVRLLQSLDHPNIIKCYGSFWSHPARVFHMVLEFAERGDLATLISTTKRRGDFLPEEQIWSLFLPVMRVAAYLHDRDIIHRDLKALNVFLTASKEIKVGDFGVSRVMSPDTLMVDTMYGTPLYLSPEICQNEPYTAKTDIWSCGVLLYELCALDTPFPGNALP
jgi:serine/threonine protein kinase